MILLLRQLLLFVRLQRTFRLVKAAGPTSRTVDHVAVPCFCEHEVAAKAAAFFDHRFPGAECTFLVSPADRGTVAALRDCDARVFEVETDGHTKAELINGFAKGLDCSIAVYDVDSLPDSLPRAPLTDRDVVQQLSIYWPRGRSSRVWEGVALNQTRWSLSYEASGSRRRHGWYLVGHGVALHPEMLRREPFHAGIHGEDLELGYRLSYAGYRLDIDYSGFDHAECEKTIQGSVEQASRWFIGEAAALTNVTQRVGVRRHLVLRLLGLGFWLGGPLGVVWLLVRATGRRRISDIGLLFVAAGIDVASYTALAGWLARRGTGDGPSLAGLMGFWLKPVLFSVGALRGLTKYRMGRSIRGPQKAQHRSGLSGAVQC